MALKASLNSVNWSNLLNKNTPDSNMTTLHNKLVEEIDHFTPLKTYKVDFKKACREPWLTAGIHISIRKAKKLYLKTLQNNATEGTRIRYNNYAKLLQRIKRKAKLSYYEDKCRSFKHKSKKLWNIINEICKSKHDKSCLIDCLKINNVLEYNDQKITNKFGEYLSSVGKDFMNKVAKTSHGPMYYCHKIPLNENSLFMTPVQKLKCIH